MRAWYRKKDRNSISTSSAYQGFSFWEKSPSMPLICGRSCGYERMARIDSPGLTIRNGKASPPFWYPINQDPGACSEKSNPLDKLRFLIRSILKGLSFCIKEAGTCPDTDHLTPLTYLHQNTVGLFWMNKGDLGAPSTVSGRLVNEPDPL